MSEITTSGVQVNTSSAPENTESQLPTSAATAAPAAESAPSPEVAAPAVDPAAANKAAEQAAAQEAELRKEAKHTLDQCETAHARGERAYRAGLLEAGRLAGLYCVQRMSLGDQRAAAVTALAGRLAESASCVVDEVYVNKLIASSHAHRLLAEEQGLTGKGKKAGPADNVPWGLYRDTWCRLTERAAKGTPEETFVLLPGLEAECREAFRKAVTDSLSRLAVQDLVAGLVRQHAQRLAEAEKAAAEDKARAVEAERQRLAEAAEQLKRAEAQKREAEAQAKARRDEQATQALAAAQVELEAKQRAAVEQQAKLEAAEKAKREAEKRAAAERQRLEREAAKAKAKAEKGQTPATKAESGNPSTASTREEESRSPKAPSGAQTRGEQVTGNLLRVGESGTPKDVAESIVALLMGAGKANAKRAADVLRIVAASLRWTKGMAVQLVEGIADNTVDPGKAEQALEALAEKAAEYVGEGFGEEEAESPAGEGKPGVNGQVTAAA
jgi:hypothetical protein